ncbi:hypothetical protein DOY81_001144 [Sarcophaga bullata]|nr:hypothetical protein DOY81_001144 [Sarcophaga bullata]
MFDYFTPDIYSSEKEFNALIFTSFHWTDERGDHLKQLRLQPETLPSNKTKVERIVWPVTTYRLFDMRKVGIIASHFQH